MHRLDRICRAAGLLLFAGAGVVGFASGAWGVLCFPVAVIGLVLVVQGKRVPLALRIERSRHRDLPKAIHDWHVEHRPDHRVNHRADQARTRRSRTDPEGGGF